MKTLLIAISSFIVGVFFTLLFFVPQQITLPSQAVERSNAAIIPENQRQVENLTHSKASDVTEVLAVTEPITQVLPSHVNEAASVVETDADSQFSAFKKLVMQHRFNQALELYQYASVDPRFRRYIFDYLYQQLENENIEKYAIVKNTAQQLLALEYDDFYYGFLLVKSSYLLGQFSEVIETVIQLKDNIEDDSFKQAVDYYYRQTLDSYTKVLLASVDIFEIENFIFQLAYIEEDTLVTQLTNRIKEIEKTQYLADLHSIKVPVTAFGPNQEHGIVTVVLNGQVTVKLMIDSGASTISLDESILSGLSYDVVHPERVYSTANGKITTTVVEIDSLEIGDISLPNVQLSAHKAENPIGNRYFDGLLGRNVLNLFNWHHDTNESILYLEPK